MVVATLGILGYKWVELVGAHHEKGCSVFQMCFVAFVFVLGWWWGLSKDQQSFRDIVPWEGNGTQPPKKGDEESKGIYQRDDSQGENWIRLLVWKYLNGRYVWYDAMPTHHEDKTWFPNTDNVSLLSVEDRHCHPLNLGGPGLVVEHFSAGQKRTEACKVLQGPFGCWQAACWWLVVVAISGKLCRVATPLEGHGAAGIATAKMWPVGSDTLTK